MQRNIKIITFLRGKIFTWNGFSHKLHGLTWQIPHNLQNTFLHVFSSNFRDFMNSDRVKLGSLKEFNAGGHSFANNKLILISFQTQGYCYNFASLNTKIISRYLCNNCRELLWNFLKQMSVLESIVDNWKTENNWTLLFPWICCTIMKCSDWFLKLYGL